MTVVCDSVMFSGVIDDFVAVWQEDGASQLTASEMQPASFLTLMPETDPEPRLLKTFPDDQLVPLSILYCKPEPPDALIVTLPALAHNVGCTRHTVKDGVAGCAFTFAGVDAELQPSEFFATKV